MAAVRSSVLAGEQRNSSKFNFMQSLNTKQIAYMNTCGCSYNLYESIVLHFIKYMCFLS